ncbi:hypothetical protein KKKDEHFA_00010 [Enterococcus phage EF_TR2]
MAGFLEITKKVDFSAIEKDFVNEVKDVVTKNSSQMRSCGKIQHRS